jgi:bleomycin hydrolase
MNKQFLIIVIIVLYSAQSAGQKKSNAQSSKTDEGYNFTTIINLKATPVKDQARTGTCWSFATTSFIESELIRMGKGEFDLSEMFIVRNNYIKKLNDYYLKQGRGDLGKGGGLSHDWMNVFAVSGIVPEEVYPGLNYGSPTHNHEELDEFMNAIVTVPVRLKNESKQYNEIVKDVLDIYLGKVPDSFTYKGISYTPETFAENLGIDPSDYIEITSFTNFPFYTTGILDVPDNWAKAQFYNVPVDELIQIIDFSLANGYTVNWDGDTSEKEFIHSKGVSSIPERIVTQEFRQNEYESFKTTDDHLMHITGISKDQYDNKYYITKNSWGTDNNPYGGFLNMSENYLRAKTLFIMVNKNSIPQNIKTKLKL